MGYEFDDLFEIIILFLIPGLLFYYLDVVSPMGYFFSLFIYLLLTGITLNGFLELFVYDWMGLLILLNTFDELQENFDDGEGWYDDADYSNGFIK